MNDLRRWATLLVVVALISLPLVGCATKAQEPTTDTMVAEEPSTMDVVREDAALRADKKEFLATALMAQGDGFYERGDFAKAREKYATVLEIDPQNQDAKAKLAKVGRLLGERVGELDDAFRDVRTRRMIKIQQARVEVEALWNGGLRLQEDGQYDEAIRSFERAALIEDLYEYDVDFTPNKEGLKRQIALANDQKEDADKARIAREIAAAQKVKEAEALREKKERTAQILMLFRDATVAFQAERYGEVENFAAEILRLDPMNGDAVQLRDLAIRSRLGAEDEVLRKRNAEEWKRTFEAFNRSTMPQVRDVLFPDDWTTRHGAAADAVSAAAPGVSAKDQEIRNILESTRVNLAFDGTSVQDAINFLSNMTQLNIVLDPKVREDKDDSELELGLTVEGIPASTALELISQSLSLKWKVANGVVFITTEEGFRANPVLHLYDVRDLVTPVRDFAGDEINLTPSGAGGWGADEDMMEDPIAPFETDGIVDLIRENVDPESWESEDVSILPTQTGTLIVRQSPDVHAKIGKLLRDLRAVGGLQVAIETRFLTVSDNFLQDIGVDLRGLGDQSGGIGAAGRGPFEPFDDLFAGTPSNPAGVPVGSRANPASIGTSNDTGIFYNDNSDGDVRARLENLFDVALGQQGVMTNSGGTSVQISYLDDVQIEAILRAVEKSERTEIVVAPKITVYNNERANVTVLNQISYIYDFDVEIAQAAQIGDPLIQTIRDGVVLDVRPIISADRKYITMELRPTVATLTRPIATFQTTLANGPPVTIQLPELKIQRVRTTVTMPDGGTLLLGGLKNFTEQRMESTAPWIDKIPVVNFFFKRQGTYVAKKNLMILIKARIIDLSELEPGFGSRN